MLLTLEIIITISGIIYACVAHRETENPFEHYELTSGE